eukprot:430611_1
MASLKPIIAHNHPKYSAITTWKLKKTDNILKFKFSAICVATALCFLLIIIIILIAQNNHNKNNVTTSGINFKLNPGINLHNCPIKLSGKWNHPITHNTTYHPIVIEMKNYIESNKSFATLINKTYIEAGYGPNSMVPLTYNNLYRFWNFWITNPPQPNNSFLCIVDTTFSRTKTGSKILSSKVVENWVARWQKARKQFCDSTDSISVIPFWIDWHKMDMSEYIIPKNGFKSFNDFFSRYIDMKYRPIMELYDNNIITAPCDGVVMNIYLNNLTSDALLNIKAGQYDLCKVVNYNKKYCKLFENGSAIQIYLAPQNYHRYHSSCSGKVEKIEFINGYQLYWPKQFVFPQVCVWMAYESQRGIMYLNNSVIGTVGHVFVGVDVVSSVNIDVTQGDKINKGHDVGCFKYGGSTILLLFEPQAIHQITVNVNDAVQVGQMIANRYT